MCWGAPVAVTNSLGDIVIHMDARFFLLPLLTATTIQYTFQHCELTNKRNKLAHMKRNMEQMALEREQKLVKESESIRALQARIHKKEKKTGTGTSMPPERAMELIQVELSGGVSDDERMWPDWAKLVEEKADEVTWEATEYRRSVQELEAILQGYKNNYGLK